MEGNLPLPVEEKTLALPKGEASGITENMNNVEGLEKVHYKRQYVDET